MGDGLRVILKGQSADMPETGPIETANNPLARIRTKGQRITE